MRVAVFDSYVTKADGKQMHFDVIVPQGTPEDQVLAFGRQYLEKVGQGGRTLTSKECRFCHIEQASPKMLEDIERDGFHILEMEGCR